MHLVGTSVLEIHLFILYSFITKESFNKNLDKMHENPFNSSLIRADRWACMPALRNDIQWSERYTVKCCVWSIALYGGETWTLRAVDQKHLEIFKMWYWRRMEKISWTDHVWNEDVLLRVKDQRNILHEMRKRKAKWIGHILRRNCLLQRVILGKIQGWIEVTGR
jgi:hypothetical protein